jgi:MoaA/NifB/PqqE/SkfB family radical SAM enzyme
VDAAPDRKEIMTRETMQLCLDVLKNNPSFTTVDVTGGAPEMNPDFRWFAEEIKKAGQAYYCTLQSYHYSIEQKIC